MHYYQTHPFVRQIYTKSYSKNQPIIFLDRDGTVIKEKEFLTSKGNIEIYKSAIKAISILNSFGFPIVIVTNQPVVARGLLDVSGLKAINNKIFDILKKNGSHVNAIYSCPHHPKANLVKYRVKCACRIPGGLLLKSVLKDFKIENPNGFMIGDRTRDIKCGKDFGLKTVLVKTGYHGKDKKFNVKPDFHCSNLLTATKTILTVYNKTS